MIFVVTKDARRSPSFVVNNGGLLDRLEICMKEVWNDLNGFRLGNSECLDTSVWLVMAGRE